MKKDDCIFCKIAHRDIPCDKVYEDDKFISFFDIQPFADGHILIIPKEHTSWMYDASDDAVSEIFKLTKKMMLILKNILNPLFVEILVMGEQVHHFHVHLIPRYTNDNLGVHSRKDYNQQSSKELSDKITRAL